MATFIGRSQVLRGQKPISTFISAWKLGEREPSSRFERELAVYLRSMF